MLKRFLIKNWFIIALAILPPAALWYFFQRERLGLRVTIEADIQVVALDQQFSDSVTIFFGTERVSSLSVIELTVENTGNRALEREAFDTPLLVIFPGRIAASPTLVGRHPEGLDPRLALIPPDTISLTPLLLNGGDRFRFRTFIANRTDSVPLKVIGRIRDVPEITVRAQRDAGFPVLDFLWVVAAIVAGVSLNAAIVLLGRVSGLSLSRAGFTVELAERLEAQKGVIADAQAMAEKLQLAGSDVKSNLLMIRLRIDELLRRVALAKGLGRRTSVLEEDGVLPRDLGAAIRDFTYAADRELHDVESYLSEEQYGVLQRLGLIIMVLLKGIGGDAIAVNIINPPPQTVTTSNASLTFTIQGNAMAVNGLSSVVLSVRGDTPDAVGLPGPLIPVGTGPGQVVENSIDVTATQTGFSVPVVINKDVAQGVQNVCFLIEAVGNDPNPSSASESSWTAINWVT